MPVGQEQRAARDPATQRSRKNELRTGGLGIEIESMKDAPEQVVGRDDRTGKRNGADNVQCLVAPMDGVRLGSVHDDDAREVFAKVPTALAKTGLASGRNFSTKA